MLTPTAERGSNASPAADAPKVTAYNYYVVLILALVYLVSSIDRTVISTVAEPLKHEFQLSDSELGVLTGLVFSISFTLCGIPLGVLVDRVNRTRLLALLVSVWSGLTFVSGFAQSYALLALARFGVGASEAGASPTSMSLITDYFPVERRGTALSFFYVSTPIGVSLGLALGGLIAANYGWRGAFLVAGIPGFILAMLLLFTVREPKRGAAEREAAPQEVKRATAGDIFAAFRRMPALALLILGGMSVVTAQAGAGAFNTPFLMRVHDVPIQQAGYALGAAHFLPGIIGVLAGGVLADRMARRSAHAATFVVGILMLLAAPVAIAAYLVEDWHLAVWLLGLHFFLNALYYGTHFSTYMSLAPVAMRGTLAAIMAVLMTLMGYGMGPVVAGVSSDLIKEAGVADPLRWAQVLTISLFLLAGVFYLATSFSIRRRAARESV